MSSHLAGRRAVCLRGLTAILLFLILATPSFAALGNTQESITADIAQMKGTARVIQAQNYAVHEIRAASGQVVREFVSPTGSVFAIAWDGPGLFDLRQLLGAYFEQYKQAMAEAHSRANTPVSLNTSGFVFQLAGNMSSFHGQAYIPQNLPPNFDFSSSNSNGAK